MDLGKGQELLVTETHHPKRYTCWVGKTCVYTLNKTTGLVKFVLVVFLSFFSILGATMNVLDSEGDWPVNVYDIFVLKFNINELTPY